MKIRIDYDEMYPVFYLTEEDSWGKEVEVNDEEARKIIMIQQAHSEMQKRLRELYDYDKENP